MSDNRIPVAIPVQPWFKDHSVGGRIVLPAVETMLLLASKCLKVYPEIDVRVMEDVRFGKLLEVPADAVTVATLVECNAEAEGRTLTKLLSHVQLGAMARIKEHGAVFFPRSKTCQLPSPDFDPSSPTGSVMKIDVETVYRDLVPFGPYYQTLQEILYLSDCQAWGRLKAPELPFIYAVQTKLGSPFPLDGAMHAACVLGQQVVDFPPFPVGFAKRVIHRPTEPGAWYETKVVMISQTPEELSFDLYIYNHNGQLYETVTGMRMRDIGKAIKKQILH